MALPPASGGGGGGFNDYMMSLMPSIPAPKKTSAPVSTSATVVASTAPHKLSEIDAMRGRACARCRRYKRRCDNGLPCRYCSSKTMDGSARQKCADCDPHISKPPAASSFASAVASSFQTHSTGPSQALTLQSRSPSVERLLPFRRTRLEIPTRGLPLHCAFSKHEMLASQFTQNIVPLAKSLDMCRAMPDDLVNSMVDAMDALKILCSDDNESLSSLKGLGSATTAIQTPAYAFEIVDDGPEAELLFESTFDANEMRVAELKMNRRFIREMLHMTEDEAVARVVAGDIDLPMPELEMFTIIMDQYLCSFHVPPLTKPEVSNQNDDPERCLSKEDVSENYYVFTPGLMRGAAEVANAGAPYLLKEQCIFLQDGARMTERCVMTRISPHEYDAARLAKPSRCRPFFAQLGDLRTARQLLEDRPVDNVTTFKHLSSTERGRRMLADLVSVVKHNFDPYIAASRAVSRAASLSSSPAPPSGSRSPGHSPVPWPSPDSAAHAPAPHLGLQWGGDGLAEGIGAGFCEASQITEAAASEHGAGVGWWGHGEPQAEFVGAAGAGSGWGQPAAAHGAGAGQGRLHGVGQVEMQEGAVHAGRGEEWWPPGGGGGGGVAHADLPEGNAAWAGGHGGALAAQQRSAVAGGGIAGWQRQDFGRGAFEAEAVSHAAVEEPQPLAQRAPVGDGGAALGGVEREWAQGWEGGGFDFGGDKTFRSEMEEMLGIDPDGLGGAEDGVDLVGSMGDWNEFDSPLKT